MAKQTTKILPTGFGAEDPADMEGIRNFPIVEDEKTESNKRKRVRRPPLVRLLLLGSKRLAIERLKIQKDCSQLTSFMEVIDSEGKF